MTNYNNNNNNNDNNGDAEGEIHLQNEGQRPQEKDKLVSTYHKLIAVRIHDV